jgi:DNA-binding MarR family transcriptional regulator
VTTQTLNPQILGQAEKAHAALLHSILDGTPNTYHRWVAFNIIVAGGEPIDRDAFVERMTGALKIDAATVQSVLDELAGERQIEVDGLRVELTDDGQETYRRIRRAVNETIGPLYAGIPADDLETAGRVLSFITTRANAELESRGR